MNRFQLTLKNPFITTIESSTENLELPLDLEGTIESITIPDGEEYSTDEMVWGGPPASPQVTTIKRNRIIKVISPKGDGTYNYRILVFVTHAGTPPTNELLTLIPVLGSEVTIEFFILTDLRIGDVSPWLTFIKNTSAKTVFHIIMVDQLHTLALAVACDNIVISPWSMIHLRPTMLGLCGDSSGGIKASIDYSESQVARYRKQIIDSQMFTEEELIEFEASDKVFLVTGDGLRKRMRAVQGVTVNNSAFD